MKRILITGGTGYIGSNLAKALIDRSQVYLLVRHPVNHTYINNALPNAHILMYDGTYESIAHALEISRPEIVYHLAAHFATGHNKGIASLLLNANIVFGAYLLESMAEAGTRNLVYASTVMEHYLGAEYRPQNLYAATKHAFYDLMTYYADTGLINAATLVLSDTYGPGDRRNKVLNLIKAAVCKNQELALSDGTQDYDLVYIDDVVSAFQMAGTQLAAGEISGGRFQVMSDAPLSLRHTVERMLKVNEVQFHGLLWGQRPQAEREIRKAVRLYPPVPGWENKVPLDEGLKRFWT